jgi:hypothetical protein
MSRAAAAACLAAFTPAALVALASRRVNGEFELPTLHVFAVTGTAAVAAAVSVLMTRAAIRRNDTRAGLVGVAFTVMAGLMTIHGLATPGVFLGEYAHNATVGDQSVLMVDDAQAQPVIDYFKGIGPEPPEPTPTPGNAVPLAPAAPVGQQDSCG